MSAKDEEIKIRVPGAMKNAIKALASKRFTSESEIAREALLEYLSSRHISLRDEATPLPPAVPASGPVTYSKKRKARTNSTAAAAAEQAVVKIVRQEASKHSSQPKPSK